jgi:mannose/fructose-specific phosphotransferase system component IIA
MDNLMSLIYKKDVTFIVGGCSLSMFVNAIIERESEIEFMGANDTSFIVSKENNVITKDQDGRFIVS